MLRAERVRTCSPLRSTDPSFADGFGYKDGVTSDTAKPESNVMASLRPIAPQLAFKAANFVSPAKRVQGAPGVMVPVTALGSIAGSREIANRVSRSGALGVAVQVIRSWSEALSFTGTEEVGMRVPRCGLVFGLDGRKPLGLWLEIELIGAFVLAFVGQQDARVGGWKPI